MAGVRSPGCGLMEAEQKARKTLFKGAPTPRVSPQPPRNRGPLRAFREESNGVYSPAQRQAQSRAASAVQDQAHGARQGKQQCASPCTEAGAEPHGLGGPRSSPMGPGRESSNARRPAQRQAQRRAAPAAPDQARGPGRESSNAHRSAQRQAQSRTAAAVQNQAGRPGEKNRDARRLPARTKSRRGEGLPLPARAQAG